MKKLIRKLSKRNKGILVTYLITLIIYIITFSFFIKNILDLNGVETFLRYFLITLFGIYFVLYFFMSLIKILDNKYKKFITLTIVSYIFIVIFILSSVFISFIYGKVSLFSEKDEVLYKSYLIALNDTNFAEDSKIGMISDEDDIEGNEIAKVLYSNNNLENEIISYDDYFDMIEDLYNKEIDAIFVTSNYISYFSSEEAYKNIFSETKILYEEEKLLENQDKFIISDKDFSEPLTFLIMGVDSATDGLDANAAFNGDTLMMVTFNPHTLNATMFSIPRDTLVPIACKNNEINKINSSAAYGTECVLDTVENLTGINVDYYVKINFYGVIDLVDAIGGISLEIEKPDFDLYNGQVCEQNADREYGSGLVCMDTGYQTLNGDQALAYSRNRTQYTGSDIDRNRHQQEVVEAVMKKAMEIRSIDKFNEILDTVSKNVITNMSPSQMFTAYDVFLDVVDNALNGETFINIEKSYLEVYTLNVFLSLTGSYRSSLGYYEDSLEDIIHMMEVNLELDDPVIDKTFNFSILDKYETYTYGQGIKTGITSKLLESVIGKTEEDALAYCKMIGISCDVITVDSDDTNYNPDIESGLVGNQSVRIGTLLDIVSSMDIYINGEIKNDSPLEDESDPIDDEIEDMIS